MSREYMMLLVGNELIEYIDYKIWGYTKRQIKAYIHDARTQNELADELLNNAKQLEYESFITLTSR